jgi:uncharacterized protein YbjT (DUF2867 family)
MTETVLVIGGTGELGAPVARQLRSDGYRVRLLARTLPAARDRDADLEYVQGDLDDTQSLSSALAGVGRLTYLSHMLAAPDAGAPALRAKFHAEQAIAASAVPSTIFRPTYFMDTLPRQVRGTRAVVLGRQPHPFHLMRVLQHAGERGDPSQANQLLGAPSTTLLQWCEQRHN